MQGILFHKARAIIQSKGYEGQFSEMTWKATKGEKVTRLFSTSFWRHWHYWENSSKNTWRKDISSTDFTAPAAKLLSPVNWTSLMPQIVRNLPARQEIQVWSLGQEDPLGREWLPTPVFLPGENHRYRSLMDYSPRGCKESGTTELLILSFPSSKLHKQVNQQTKGGAQRRSIACIIRGEEKTKQREGWEETRSQDCSDVERNKGKQRGFVQAPPAAVRCFWGKRAHRRQAAKPRNTALLSTNVCGQVKCSSIYFRKTYL